MTEAKTPYPPTTPASGATASRLTDEEWDYIADLGIAAKDDREWFALATEPLRDQIDALEEALEEVVSWFDQRPAPGEGGDMWLEWQWHMQRTIDRVRRSR